MDLKLEKNLCAWGLLSYMVLQFVPCVGILSLAGLIVYAIGVFRISKKTNKSQIFQNFIISIIILTLTIIVVFIGLILGINKSSINLDSDIPIFFVIFVILYIGLVISSSFYKKYLDIVYEITQNQLFRYAGLVIYWGSILLMIPLLIGKLIEIIAFFTMPEYIENSIEREQNKKTV